MKYYQLASVTTPEYIQEWLKEEFEKRGIDEVYVRYILSILHVNYKYPEPIECQDTASRSRKVCQEHGTVYGLQYFKRKPKKRTNKIKRQFVQSTTTYCEPTITWDIRDENKNAAVDCLLSNFHDLVEEDIEELVEHIFIKLRDYQEEVSCTNEENINPPILEGEAEQYSLAFPPLSNTSSLDATTKSSQWTCRSVNIFSFNDHTIRTVPEGQSKTLLQPLTYKDSLLNFNNQQLLENTSSIKTDTIQLSDISLEKETPSIKHKFSLKRSLPNVGPKISSFKTKRSRKEGFYEEESKNITFIVGDNMFYKLPTKCAEFLLNYFSLSRSLSNHSVVCIVEVFNSIFAAVSFFEQLSFLSNMRTHFSPLPEFTPIYKNMYTWPWNLLPGGYLTDKSSNCLAINNVENLVKMEEEKDFNPYNNYISATLGSNHCQSDISASGVNHSSMDEKNLFIPECGPNSATIGYVCEQQVVLNSNIQDQHSKQNITYAHELNTGNDLMGVAMSDKQYLLSESQSETIRSVPSSISTYHTQTIPSMDTSLLPSFLFSSSPETYTDNNVNSQTNNSSENETVKKLQMVCESCYSRAQKCNHVDVTCSEIPKFPGWHLKENTIYNGKFVYNPWFKPVHGMVTSFNPNSCKDSNEDEYSNHFQNDLQNDADTNLHIEQTDAFQMAASAFVDNVLPQYVYPTSMCVDAIGELPESAEDNAFVHYTDSEELQFNSTYVPNSADMYYNISAGKNFNESTDVVFENEFDLSSLAQCYDLNSLGYSRWSVHDQYDNDNPGSIDFAAAAYSAYCDKQGTGNYYNGTETIFQQDRNIHHKQLYSTGASMSDEASKKICYYHAIGECRFAKCKYSHDLSNTTCKYWLQGSCFKDSTCPFLHALPPNSNPDISDFKSQGKLPKVSLQKSEQVRKKSQKGLKRSDCTYKLDSEVDFPTLSQAAIPVKSKIMPKKDEDDIHLSNSEM